MAALFLHLITFLAAFLLFQIELIIAKLFLPVYGGSYFVWSACLVFFQVFLLFGYLFVHLAVQKYGMLRYRIVQLVLIFLPFLFFPGHPLKVQGNGISPFLAGDVFWRLFGTIGPVFFVLSTMSVALQMWLSASSLKEKANPYALYATSNAGSLAAILTYPFLFEVLFDLRTQEGIWRLCYLALALLNICLFLLVPVASSASRPERPICKVEKRDVAIWLFLSAAGVMLFMAVTNIITYAIAPVPLLWVIPLSIYLMAFILSFKHKPWRPRWLSKYISVVLVGCSCFYFLLQNKNVASETEFFIFCLALFFICLYCQNELAAQRPSSDESLTIFYLMISLGGCAGGILTSWVMPLISRSVIEYLLALTCVAAAARLIEKKTVSASLMPWFRHLQRRLLIIVPLLLAFFWARDFTGTNSGELYKKRNYYGIYEVLDKGNIRVLAHGTTMHGAQLQVGAIKLEPSSFYSKTSPIGELLTSPLFDFRDICLIGLGAGTLPIYTHPGQNMDIYELDPDVYSIAKRYFTFLDNAKGNTRVIYGDARLSLDKVPDKRYDILIVDAFGGDSIPFHLLTTEAITKYRTHLTEHGIVLFHISNRYIRLEPVLIKAADDLKAFVGYRATSGAPYGVPSIWMSITWDQGQFLKLFSDLHWYPIAYMLKERHRTWTDNYSNILPVIDIEKIKNSFPKLKWPR